MNELTLANKAAEWSKLKSLVLDSVSSPITKRVYNLGLDEFFAWYGLEPRPGFSKATVAAWRVALEARGLGAVSINVRITAVRKLAVEAADNGLLAPELANGITRVKGVASKGVRLGNWLTAKQAQALLNSPDAISTKGMRDRAILAVLLGCGLRRSEVAALTFKHIQQRDGRWCIVDLVGKHGRVRTVPMPTWVKVAIDAWATLAAITDGPVFRSMNQGGTTRLPYPAKPFIHLQLMLHPLLPSGNLRWLCLEGAVSKKWYNLFVTVDPASTDYIEPSDSAREDPTNAARMVAEIAASVPAVSTFSTPVNDPTSFAEIYQAAEIATPAHGYTILKVASMLQSEHLHGLPQEVKRSSILVALEATGAKIDDIIEDAVRRDRALDSFETVLAKSRSEVEAAKIEENRKIEAEMNKMLADYRARIQANNEAVAKENERFAKWQAKKQAEERIIAEAVGYFVSENPITLSGAPAAADTPAKSGK